MQFFTFLKIVWTAVIRQL